MPGTLLFSCLHPIPVQHWRGLSAEFDATVVRCQNAGDTEVGYRSDDIGVGLLRLVEVDGYAARDFSDQRVCTVGNYEDGSAERGRRARIGGNSVTAGGRHEQDVADTGGCRAIDRRCYLGDGGRLAARGATASADARPAGFGKHVVEYETFATDFLDVVDLCAAQVIQRDHVDQDLETIEL